jgi:hypothetical protein
MVPFFGMRAQHEVRAKCGTQIPRTTQFEILTQCKKNSYYFASKMEGDDLI